MFLETLSHRIHWGPFTWFKITPDMGQEVTVIQMAYDSVVKKRVGMTDMCVAMRLSQVREHNALR